MEEIDLKKYLRYIPTRGAGISLFQIPVVLNEDMEISGTTIAMGAPHTITYTIHISLDTAKLQKSSPEDTAAKLDQRQL